MEATNRMKLFSRGDTRNGQSQSGLSPEACLFCPAQAQGRYELVNGTMAALRDGYPVSHLHYLIVPLRHCSDYFSLTSEEREDAHALLEMLKQQIVSQDPSVNGFNIGMNCGEVAGQTVLHAHIHLIPRRFGDTSDPRGGVRGVIPEKMNYSGSCLEEIIS
jgi:diadenosine tetraphosphate (Ap4A) HIT family hydrolase